jgi:hypothetical protein
MRPDTAAMTRATGCAPGQVTLPNGQCGNVTPAAPRAVQHGVGAASSCPPGQFPLPNGQCGHVTPHAAQRLCPPGAVQYGTRCFPLPPSASPQQVTLAYKTLDSSKQAALAFYARIPGVASNQGTANAFVWSAGKWQPTSLDAHMLSTMAIVGGQVPAGHMLAIQPTAAGGTELVIVPATNAAVRPVVNSVSGVGAPQHHAHAAHGGGVKPILNAVRAHVRAARHQGVAGPSAKAAHPKAHTGGVTPARAFQAVHRKVAAFKPAMPVGAGRAESFIARRAAPMAVGAPAKLSSYITKRGDTLVSVAKAYGVPVAMLRKLNPGLILGNAAPMSGGFRLNLPSRTALAARSVDPSRPLPPRRSSPCPSPILAPCRPPAATRRTCPPPCSPAPSRAGSRLPRRRT